MASNWLVTLNHI